VAGRAGVGSHDLERISVRKIRLYLEIPPFFCDRLKRNEIDYLGVDVGALVQIYRLTAQELPYQIGLHFKCCLLSI